MISNRGVSTAANRWQKGLILAIQQLGKQVITLGHLPDSLWPKGGLILDSHMGVLPGEITGNLVGYWNLPFLRKFSLIARYRKETRRLIDTHGYPDAVIIYNPYPHNIVTGLWAQSLLGIPMICIVADPPLRGESSYFKRISHSAGCVFLPWLSYKKWHQTPKLHLDGGIEKIKSFYPLFRSTEKVSILYTGLISKANGIELLLRGFQLLKNKDTELWLCGKCFDQKISDAIVNDSRIKYFGVVSEKKLEELSMKTKLFVNPRLSNIPKNHEEFPSKILEYLSYGKPIITTKTDGISPEYKDVLVFLEKETPECMANTIDDVLQWNDNLLENYYNRVCGFVKNEKLWSLQAEKLLDWISREITVSRNQIMP